MFWRIFTESAVTIAIIVFLAWVIYWVIAGRDSKDEGQN